ncbi:hypothetical protein FOA43_000267 [Brettanomyces nanus]|uniref:Protein CASP n=1 Tax=Eeniella nana TaxID=13502 RepID=A0A875RWU1_EENNA|nr:uncharacterized protein FOA43_000267 [Brettanomyces nanus]QPG72963.1 hypothetical protein FOA43_000267 [Brettanomyces nanus]
MSETRNPHTKLVESTAVFDKALESWSIIDLPGLQKQLDKYALEFQDYQKQSLLDRKHLASKTKSFKKLPSEEKVNEIKPLLKSYQKEIDDLAKKNKNVDNAFFQFYRVIVEAPDPKSLLQMSLDAVSSMPELEKVKEENRQLEEKLLGFADYEQIKANNAKLEEELIKAGISKVKAKDDEWQVILEEKQKNWDEEKKDYQRNVDVLKKQIEDMKINEEMMKLKIDNKNKALRELDEDYEAGEEVENWKESKYVEVEDGNASTSLSSSANVQQRAASNIEIQILNRDVESLKLRIMELEKRNEELRREASLAKSGTANEKTIQAIKKRTSELESENSVLTARLEHERQVVDRLTANITAVNDTNDKNVQRLMTELDWLKNYKSQTRDYDEIKKELEVLRQIEFGDEDDVRQKEDQDPASVTSDASSGVDSAIVQRNKKLNKEVIEYRSENEDLHKKYDELSSQLKDSVDQLKESRQINEKLENDLENLDSSASAAGNKDRWETMSMISSIASSPMGDNGKISPATSIARGLGGNAGAGIMDPNRSLQDSSILPIITQQRDRFRMKNKELEEEAKKQFGKIVDLKREVRTLKSDNKDLYERIRFMEYHQATLKGADQVDTGSIDDVENRYKESYETQLHPIEKFRRMESKRISSRLSPFERVFIQVTKLILSTKYTRWLFAFYCLGLHFLVLILTVSLMANTTSSMLPAKSIVSGSTGGIANGVVDRISGRSKLDSKQP